MAGDLAGGRRDRADAATRGEARLRTGALGVVAGDEQQLGGRAVPDAVGRDQLEGELEDDGGDHVVESGDLVAAFAFASRQRRDRDPAGRERAAASRSDPGVMPPACGRAAFGSACAGRRAGPPARRRWCCGSSAAPCGERRAATAVFRQALRTRMASIVPSRLLGVTTRLRAKAAGAAAPVVGPSDRRGILRGERVPRAREGTPSTPPARSSVGPSPHGSPPVPPHQRAQKSRPASPCSIASPRRAPSPRQPGRTLSEATTVAGNLTGEAMRGVCPPCRLTTAASSRAMRGCSARPGVGELHPWP